MTLKDAQERPHCVWGHPEPHDKAAYWDSMMDYLEVHSGHKFLYEGLPEPHLGHFICLTCGYSKAEDGHD